jgi:Protein of unknown function (DUF3179)
MAESASENSIQSANQGAARPATAADKLVVKVGVAAVVVAVGVYLLAQVSALWNEFGLLQREVRESQKRGVVGYLNIAPISSFAEGPKDWYRSDGRQLLLWSGWEQANGQQRWLRFAHGEIDPTRFVRPTAVFVSQAIDYPLVETGRGAIWERIPADSKVVGSTLEGQKCAYPVAVLGKVMVINDVVGERPYLVVLNPFAAAPALSFSIFEAELEGHRVTMNPTSYFQDRKPVLYDRGTESLWVERDGFLTAFAGKHSGKHLNGHSHPTPIAWSEWVSQNSQSRLVVGADRTRGIPTE